MNPNSFADALREYKDPVYGYALYILGNEADAEDVTQDVFVAFWRHGGAVAERARRAWLIRTCRNACMDVLRRRKVRRRTTVHLSDSPPPVGGRAEDQRGTGEELPFDVTDGGDGALSIDKRLELREIMALMTKLNESRRSALVLREIYDLPYDEIAGILGISMSALKVTLHRARRELRAQLTTE